MSYPKQDTVGARLHGAIHKALDDTRNQKKAALKKNWAAARRELVAAIVDAYRRAAPDGRWTLVAYRATGAENTLRVLVHGVMLRFHAITTAQMRAGFRQARNLSALGYAWALDQITPRNIKVRLPAGVGPTAREAGAPGQVLKIVTDAQWEDRWSHWVDSYQSALLSNVKMNAINRAALSDTLDEVDQTRVNTPASTLENAMDRLYDYEAMRAIADGENAVVQANAELVDKEVWKTRGDVLVCDDCDANEGLTAEEADGDIPNHPNCHCLWIVVPASYADLLKSGDEDDRALARDMQARGIVPIAMTVRDENGGLAAKAIVDFSEWMAGQFRGVGSR